MAAGITFQLPCGRDVGPLSKNSCRARLCLLVAGASGGCLFFSLACGFLVVSFPFSRAPTRGPERGVGIKEGVPASQSTLLLGPEHSLRWGSHSMSSCDGVRPIVVEPVLFIPKGSPKPHAKAPANPISQGTSPITGLVYAAICGTKKYLSFFLFFITLRW